jgi:hypothetical protein
MIAGLAWARIWLCRSLFLLTIAISLIRLKIVMILDLMQIYRLDR